MQIGECGEQARKRGRETRIRTKNRPLSVSLRWRSTALWVARRSAVFARRLGLRFMLPLLLPEAAADALLVLLLLAAPEAAAFVFAELLVEVESAWPPGAPAL